MRGVDDGPDGLNDRAFDRALGAKPKSGRAAPYEALHWQTSRGRAACGVKLTTKHQAVDEDFHLDEREGSRCKRCWRIVEIRRKMDAEHAALSADVSDEQIRTAWGEAFAGQSNEADKFIADCETALAGVDSPAEIAAARSRVTIHINSRAVRP